MPADTDTLASLLKQLRTGRVLAYRALIGLSVLAQFENPLVQRVVITRRPVGGFELTAVMGTAPEGRVIVNPETHAIIPGNEE